jgi:hypothetical protein
MIQEYKNSLQNFKQSFDDIPFILDLETYNKLGNLLECLQNETQDFIEKVYEFKRYYSEITNIISQIENIDKSFIDYEITVNEYITTYNDGLLQLEPYYKKYRLLSYCIPDSQK